MVGRKQELPDALDKLPESSAIRRVVEENNQRVRRIHLKFDVRDVLGICAEQRADIEHLKGGGFFLKQRVRKRGRKIYSSCVTLIRNYANTLGTNSLDEIHAAIISDMKDIKHDEAMNIFENAPGDESHSVFQSYLSMALADHFK